MTSASDTPTHQASRQLQLLRGPGAGTARTDIVIAVLLGVTVIYSLVLWPLTPALLGPHPLLLEILSGSTVSEVTVGAHSRLHELPVWVAVAAGVPGTMMFDWVFWWAGRRWGDRALHLFLGRGTSPRDVVGSSRVDLQACKLEYSIVSPK